MIPMISYWIDNTVEDEPPAWAIWTIAGIAIIGMISLTWSILK